MTGGVSPRLREENLARLRGGTFDVLVVGGGINGATCAAALAARGASVALIERGDFACTTSQESSNLIWGGIKYLENRELGLVWKLCRARNELVRSHPSGIREIRFFAPVERRARGLRRTIPALWAGTWLYWLMGRGFTRTPRWLTRRRIEAEEPAVDASIVKGGVEYSDAYLVDNDARFVFGFVRTALADGATACNYVESTSSSHREGGWDCSALDRVSGAELSLRAGVLVNAAGPYVDALNRANGITTRAHHVFSKGIHLIVDRVTTRDHVLTFFDETDRMFFVLPMEHRSVIGTTDTRVDSPEARVTDEDRHFVLENVNRRLRLSAPLRVEDVIAERCGVRPLVVEGEPRAEGTAWFHLSRKHVLDVDAERRCISVFGGKLTDCLNVGAEVAEHVRALGLPLAEPSGRWYGEPPLAERDDFLARARRLAIDGQELHEALSGRLWRRYGRDAFALLDQIERDPKMADVVIAGTRLRRCELHHAAEHEMVVCLEDLLRRRTRIALLERRADLERAAGLLEACEILAPGQGAALLEEWLESTSS